MAQPAYLLVPQSNPIPNGQAHLHRPSFALPPYSNTILAPNLPGSSSQPNQAPPSHPASTIFRAPAHKHAHHLHTIPPREKSTRTLIIDHILWVHARTRFAQARAELGMTDRCGGPESSNYVHRERPENYDEEEEAESDGETVEALLAKKDPASGGAVPDPITTVGGTLGLAFGAPRSRTVREIEEELRRRRERQDLRLAKSLKLRAEGLEKTVTSMLDQPPPVHPFPDDLMTPKQPRSRNPHPHTLPNGVRLRLALATLYNDLFSRGRPPPAAANGMPDGLPYVLGPLSCVSSVATSNTSRTGGVVFAKLWSGTQTSYHPPRASSLEPDERAISLYASGARPRFTNTTYTYPPPSTRCSRHLYSGCPICLELTTRPATTRFGFAPGLSCSLVRAEWKGRYRMRNGAGMADCEKEESLAEVVVRFIRLSALAAMELAREVGHIGVDEEESGDDGDDEEGEVQPDPSRSPDGTGEAGTSSDRGAYSSSTFNGHPQVFATQYTIPAPMPNNTRVPPSSASNASSSFQHSALQPTREWYILLIGLLTRAALEGYLVGGWEGYKAVECLFGVGLGIPPNAGVAHSSWNGKDVREEEEDEEEEFMRFEPDDLPDLQDAVKILFPSLKFKDVPGAKSQAEGAEKEYQTEMKERQKKFFDVPADVTDLSTHLEELATVWPAEPVERAALRYYEAIAKWRGKPELETYKKRPPRTWTTSGGSPHSVMESFLRSNPTSPASVDTSTKSRKQPIERFFISPSMAARRKRARSRSPAMGGIGGTGKRGRADSYSMGGIGSYLT